MADTIALGDPLPDGATGIRWPASGWIDCAAFLASPRWTSERRRGAYDLTTEVEAMFGPVVCTDPVWCDRCQGNAEVR